MIRSKINKQIFAKSNYPVYFSFVLLAIINIFYVTAEINKPNVLKSMGYDITESSVFQVSKAEIERLSAVSNYSLQFESAFIIISLLCMIFLLTKRVRPFFTSLIIMTFGFFSILFLLNISLAAIFEAPQGNLTQLLVIPFQLLVLTCIYGFLKFRNQIH